MTLLGTSLLAQAQNCVGGGDGVDLQNCIKINDQQSVSDLYPTVSSLINVLVPNLFIIAGVIFLFLMIFAGVRIISSGSSKGVEEGQKQLTTAVVGFVVMFSAYWIVQIVEFITKTNILNNTF